MLKVGGCLLKLGFLYPVLRGQCHLDQCWGCKLSTKSYLFVSRVSKHKHTMKQGLKHLITETMVIASPVNLHSQSSVRHLLLSRDNMLRTSTSTLFSFNGIRDCLQKKLVVVSVSFIIDGNMGNRN